MGGGGGGVVEMKEMNPQPATQKGMQATPTAEPSASTASAVAGMLMRFVVQRGMESTFSCFSFLVTHAKPARGTQVAMVGMRAACCVCV